MLFRTEIYNIPNHSILTFLNTDLNYSYTESLCVVTSCTKYSPYMNSLVPVPATIGAPLQGNAAFYTAAGGGGLNGNAVNFYRRGRIIQFDLSGRW